MCPFTLLATVCIECFLYWRHAKETTCASSLKRFATGRLCAKT